MSVSESVEVERTYDVEVDTSLPDVNGLPGVASVSPPVTHALRAVYFDTDDLVLARHRATLRQREGGTDDAWHLKLPVRTDARRELSAPLGGDQPPASLLALVQVHLRGRPVAPAATVSTSRTVRMLRAQDGSVLAELCDDLVEGHDLAAGGASITWREWELELVAGDDALLEAMDALVEEAGGRSAAVGSKLARALGGRLPSTGVSPTEPGPSGSAADVLHLEVKTLVEDLKSRDPLVRLDEADAVHKMRVATRRLRSLLGTFRRLLDDATCDFLGTELKWLAEVLGKARDAEVMRDRLNELPPLHQELDRRYRSAHADVVEALDTTRYFALLHALDAFVADPPWRGRARRQASDVLPELVERDFKRLRRRVRSAERAVTPDDYEDHLHEVRKAAKRLRYACEAMTPCFGRDAKALGRAAENVQEVLGEHQDSVVTRILLQELAGLLPSDPDSQAALGRLELAERQHAAAARNRYADTWSAASDKDLRRWLTH